MKLRFFCFVAVFSALGTFSGYAQQNARTLLDEGLRLAQAGKLAEAVGKFDASLALQDGYPVRQSRGMAYSLLRQYEAAVTDFTKAIGFNKNARKSYLSRGIARKKLTDYQGAITDFTAAIGLDATLAEAYYNRAMVYELLGKTPEACNDFRKALQLGMKPAELQVEMCTNPLPAPPNRRPLLKLAPAPPDRTYGLSEKNPVKVGTSPAGEYENLNTYLELLRDAQGRPVPFRQVKTLPYASPNAPGGRGTLQVFELQPTGSATKTLLYLTINDFETPRVPAGFSTAK